MIDIRDFFDRIEALLICQKLHFQADFSFLPPLVKIQTHEGFVEEKEREIDSLSRKLPFKTYVKKVFEAARGCNFVIFGIPQKVEFIQYWIGGGTYWFDFPIQKNNDNSPYREELIKLLRKLNFKKKRKVDKYFSFLRYDLTEAPERLIVEANFGKDTELAAKFTSQVVQKLFRISLWELSVELG